MERDSGREKFTKRKRLNIVAGSVAAISIAAAAAGTAEKTGLFDPLSNPVNSANHLVLNNLHDSYNMLIDKLPEVEKAEAAAVTSTCTTIASSVWTCNNPIADGDHIALVITGTKTCHANVYGGGVGEGGVFDVHVVADAMNVNCATFGGYPVPVDATICCGEAAPEPGKTPTAVPAGVGGIAHLPNVEPLPQDINSEKSKDYTTPIAAGLASATAAVVAAGTTLYIRRNRSA